MGTIKQIIRDAAKLKYPVTASALVLLVVNLAAPFGIDIDTDVALGVITAVGVVFAYVSTLLDRDTLIK